MKTYRLFTLLLIGALPCAVLAQDEIILRGPGQDNTVVITGDGQTRQSLGTAATTAPAQPGVGIAGPGIPQVAPVTPGSLGSGAVSDTMAGAAGPGVSAGSEVAPVAPGALGLSAPAGGVATPAGPGIPTGLQVAPVPAGALGVTPTAIAPDGTIIPATSGLGFPAPGITGPGVPSGTQVAPVTPGSVGSGGSGTTGTPAATSP